MTTAYSYIRFSSEKQKLGDSLRRQIELSDAYVKEHNLTLDTTLNLHDLGISAFKKKNVNEGALRVFLDAVEKGTITPGSYLLVESLDRISRAEVMDALSIFTSIINAGITIVTLADNQLYSRETIKANWTSLIMSLAIMARAHEESLMKSQRVKAAWANRKKNIASKKITSKCPSWMTLTPDGKKFKLIPEKVKVVRQIIKMSKDGQGIDGIAKVLNKERLPPITSGKSWSNTFIQRLFDSTSLYGEANFTGMEPIPDYYPPLITKEEWLKLKAAREARRYGGGGAKRFGEITNLFSGLTVCGHCGEKMWVSSYTEPANQTSPKRIIKYYICGRYKTGRGCVKWRWNLDEFEALILRYLTELDVNDIIGSSKLASRLDELRTHHTSLLVTLTEANQKIDRLTQSIAEGVQPKAVIVAITKLETEVLGLNRMIAEVSEKISTEELSDSVIVEQQNHLRTLTNVLSSESGIKLQEIRARIQEQVRGIVIGIQMNTSSPSLKSSRYASVSFRSKNVVKRISENDFLEFKRGSLTI